MYCTVKLVSAFSSWIVYSSLFVSGFYSTYTEAVKVTSVPSGGKSSLLKSVSQTNIHDLLKEFTVPPDTPIVSLDAEKAFDGLQNEEKWYNTCNFQYCSIIT